MWAQPAVLGLFSGSVVYPDLDTPPERLPDRV
jgi:hypothetical protein